MAGAGGRWRGPHLCSFFFTLNFLSGEGSAKRGHPPAGVGGSEPPDPSREDGEGATEVGLLHGGA